MVRSSPLLPAVVLGACGGILVSMLSGTQTQSFLTAAPGNGRAHGRTAMPAFKDDFLAWRSTLSSDDKALMVKQTNGEFDKKFRKSPEYSKDLGADKLEAFSKILQKFVESEAEDYKKEQAMKTPDYTALQRKTTQKEYDFSLKERIVLIDRDADRRYQSALKRIAQAARKGEKYPQASPLEDKYFIVNNDTDSHEFNKRILEIIVEASKHASFDPKGQNVVDELVKKGIPPMGQEFVQILPEVVMQQLEVARYLMQEYMKKMSEADLEEFKEGKFYEVFSDVFVKIQSDWVRARDEVADDAQKLKAFFRSQRLMPGKTKADVLKEIWAELPKFTDKPVTPLDEETLAELAKEPATTPEEFMHSWGTADKLWKSEAIDSFGNKYLLGVFESPEDASKAFASWNAEYEKARLDMKADVQQWSKQEQAKMDSQTEDTERIRKLLEEARR